MVNETLESTQRKAKGLVEDNEGLEKMVQYQAERLEFKNDEGITIKKEYDITKSDLKKFKTELEILKVSELKLRNMMIECDKCDARVKNLDDLKVHNKIYHSHSKASQYEQDKSFNIFNCFYCEVTIGSEDQLDEHFATCKSEPDFIWEPWESFPCELCGAECWDSDDLERP